MLQLYMKKMEKKYREKLFQKAKKRTGKVTKQSWCDRNGLVVVEV